MTDLPPLGPVGPSASVSAHFVEGVNGLRLQLLEASHEEPGRPRLLLHGFPKLTHSWCKVMPALADAGYHVLAPDLRGYGQTTAGAIAYDADLAPYRMQHLLFDLLCLLGALRHERGIAVIGHDFGSWVAGFCALVRPDVFIRLSSASHSVSLKISSKRRYSMQQFREMTTKSVLIRHKAW